MSETRKLAAILAADVVGYSRLAICDLAHGNLARRYAMTESFVAVQPGSPIPADDPNRRLSVAV